MAVLESVYVDWIHEVYLLDMKDAKSYLDQGSFEQVRIDGASKRAEQARLMIHVRSLLRTQSRNV